MTRLKATLFITCACALLLTGCPGEIKDPSLFNDVMTECDLGQNANVEALLIAKCGSANCHGSASPSAGLDLETANVGARLSNVSATGFGCTDRSLIVAGNASSSYLIQKLSNDSSDYCQSKMPIGGVLDPREVVCIEDWINDLGGMSQMDAGMMDAASDAASGAGDGGAQ